MTEMQTQTEITIPLGELLDEAVAALAAADAPSPRPDAESILAMATGRDRPEPGSTVAPGLTSDEYDRFSAMLERRLDGEPLAYILGKSEFRYITLEVDPRVLIPRPETEMLVELAVELNPRSLLEIGTGSGAISLAVADELPDCEITATDISPDALAVARANAERLGLSDRIEFLETSLPGPGEYDLILTNLPYVGADDSLSTKLTRWEPGLAIVPGPTGLETIETVLRGLQPAGISAGAIGLEVGERQANTVAGFLREGGFARTEIRNDLAGIGRIVAGFA